MNKRIYKVLNIILCFSTICFSTLSFHIITNASTQTSAITVANAARITSTGAYSLDGSMANWTTNGTRYFITSDNWGDDHQKFSGTADDPMQTPIFEKTRANFFTNNGSINGRPWVMSIYKDSYGGLLAFMHMEFVTANGSSNKGRIALAYSTNEGATFTYCGEIISGYGDPDMSGGFLQGCPYFVKDGYFYTYYQFGGICVARAAVSDVISAARNNTVSTWKKYYSGTWNQNGLGGAETTLKGASGVDITGVVHSQAVYSTYNGKYYLSTTWMNWSSADTYVKLWESSDGVTWELYKIVVQEPAGNYSTNDGWQYTSILDYGGNINSTVGQIFYLYGGNKPYDTTNMTLKRWTIDLSNAPMNLYNFDGNANDSAGMDNGTVTGGASYTTGKSGQGINFDGVNDYVNIPNSSNLSGMPQLTVSCWVKLTQLPTQSYVIVGKDSSDYQYRIIVSSGGTATFVVNTVNNSWYSAGTYANSSSALSSGAWYHIIGTYNGNYVRIYINGSLAGTGSQAISGVITTGVSPLRIGYKSGSLIDYTKGIIDEVQIYNRALGSTDVTNLYNRYGMTATSHTASLEFGSSQGGNNWYYYMWGSGGSTQMTWDSGNSRWYGSGEPYCLIGGNYQHPGSAADSVRAWYAPAGSNIEIKGNVSIGSGGDGVIVSILKNGDVIWTSTLSASANINFDILTTVAYGDGIYFKVNRLGNNYYDSTAFDPTIIAYN